MTVDSTCNCVPGEVCPVDRLCEDDTCAADGNGWCRDCMNAVRLTGEALPKKEVADV